MKKSLIKSLIREAIQQQLKEIVEYKNVTTDQFLKMVQQIKQQKLFPNAKWGFKDSMGGGTTYIPFSEFVIKMTDQVRRYKTSQDPITNYYIWNMEGGDLRYGDVMKIVNAGPDAILQFAQTQGDKVTKIATSWDSKGSEEFAKAMGRGDYGSLDESAMSDLNLMAQESTTFEAFVKRIQQEMPEVGQITPDVRKFLQVMYDETK
jgi:hypothetical protein